ncbi:hypothetical protein ACHAXR_006419, partial [Thalassiosira sp. AJA248-18]
PYNIGEPAELSNSYQYADEGYYNVGTTIIFEDDAAAGCSGETYERNTVLHMELMPNRCQYDVETPKPTISPTISMGPTAGTISTPTEYTPKECNSWLSTLISSDADFLKGISESEYLMFLSNIEDPPYASEYFKAYDNFDDLPWVFRIVHKSLACHCETLPGYGEDCCQGDDAQIPLQGLENNINEEYKDLVCQQIQFMFTRLIASPTPTADPTAWPSSSPTPGPTYTPTFSQAQSFDECVLQSIFAIPRADADPFTACCVDFPDTTLCAYFDCFDETDVFTCECSVAVDFLTEMEMGSLAEVTGGKFVGTAAASTACCQEGTSSSEFQACMDEKFPDGSTGGGLSLAPSPSGGGNLFGGFSFSPTSSPAPEICPDENDALMKCHTTDDDPFGFGSFSCSFCYHTVTLENLFGFLTCDDMTNNNYCASFAVCASEECNPECMGQAYDLLHCSLDSYDECDLQCSPDDQAPDDGNTPIILPVEVDDDCVEQIMQGMLVFGTELPDIIACCAANPDAPYCTYQNCVDQATGEIDESKFCDCSVMVDLYSDPSFPVPVIDYALESCCTPDNMTLSEAEECMTNFDTDPPPSGSTLTSSPTKAPGGGGGEGESTVPESSTPPSKAPVSTPGPQAPDTPDNGSFRISATIGATVAIAMTGAMIF